MKQFAQDAQLGWRKIARAVHVPIRVRIKAARVWFDPRQTRKLFARFVEASPFLQFHDLQIAQREQKVRVLARIGEMLVRQRTLPPIRALHFLVQGDAKTLLQYRSQPDIFPTQDARGDHRVKQIRELKLVIAFHAQNVVLCRVKNFFDCRVRKERREAGNVGKRERVYEIIVSAGRELQQANFFKIGIQAV